MKKIIFGLILCLSLFSCDYIKDDSVKDNKSEQDIDTGLVISVPIKEFDLSEMKI